MGASVLLREPHGFEGVRPILEIILPNDQASAHGEDLEERLADGQAASRSMSAQLDGDEKPVSEVENLLGIEAHVLEAFKHLAPNLQVAVMAVEGPRHVEEYIGPVKLDAGIEAGEKEIEVPAIRRRGSLANTTHKDRSTHARVSRQSRPPGCQPTGERREANDNPFIHGPVSPRFVSRKLDSDTGHVVNRLLRHRPRSIAHVCRTCRRPAARPKPNPT